MRHILQEEPCGCGLACVASVVGRTYEEVARVAEFFLEHDCRKQGTTTFEIHVVLRLFNFESPPQLIPLRGKKLCELTTDALLKCKWHWCVWDAKKKRVIDPLSPPDPWVKPSAYLPVTIRDRNK